MGGIFSKGDVSNKSENGGSRSVEQNQSIKTKSEESFINRTKKAQSTCKSNHLTSQLSQNNNAIEEVKLNPNFSTANDPETYLCGYTKSIVANSTDTSLRTERNNHYKEDNNNPTEASLNMNDNIAESFQHATSKCNSKDKEGTVKVNNEMTTNQCIDELQTEPVAVPSISRTINLSEDVEERKEEIESKINESSSNLNVGYEGSYDLDLKMNVELRDSFVQKNMKKTLLKAPPPSEEVGSVLVERIVPIGKKQNLISYSKTRPSSSFYIAPAYASPTEDGETLPPYSHEDKMMQTTEYEVEDLSALSGPQDWSSGQVEMKPTFGDNDFVPAADWLDIDYKYNKYFENDPITGDFNDRRKKFNLDDYKININPEEEKIYLKILETIDDTPNLGKDPETFNACWLKETILRILERSGKYNTKYYDEQGNEYSLRSSRPSYALADWAKDYLSTVKPEQKKKNATSEKKVESDYYVNFEPVNKRMNQKIKSSSKPKPQPPTTFKNQFKKDSTKGEENLEISPKRDKKLNIIPKERQTEIYNLLSTNQGTAQVMESLLTPQNQMKILEELAKPTPVPSKQPYTEKGGELNANDSQEPDLENIFEILMGDNIKEKKAIYDMMKTPVGKETVYEALCRVGSEKYPELYESYDEDEDVYAGRKSFSETKKENKLQYGDKKKKEKRKIVIQTPPYPDDVPYQLGPEEMEMDEENQYDPNDIENNPEKQQHVLDMLKLSYILNPQNEELPDSDPMPKPTQSQTNYNNIDAILSTLDGKHEIYNMLKTPDGRDKVLDALCRIGKTQNPKSYQP
ncbi:uncharacterized protein LOC128982607 [Macrosteles quadrilineatus]|uniref:uncharacterized protein LOC128982607 n=1 Tax=Macrosteles quadrilineatus TaxID=74068 RepID=UPI0023E2A3CE|nr:uncharacterized protein LOC128982607 [Macrosteles quadrilineatus]